MTTWPKWLSATRREMLVDWLPALALLTSTEISIWFAPTTGTIPGPAAFASPLYLVAMLALGFRRSLPLPAMLFVLATNEWEVWRLPADVQGSFEGFLALCLAAYAVGAYSQQRGFLVAGVLLPAIVPLSDTLRRGLFLDEGWQVSEILPFFVWAGVFCLIGRGVRSRLTLVDLLSQRADRLEEEREQATRSAIAEERARIARELHDVVAHAVSVMVVQSGAARRILRSDLDQAERSLLAVEATGRQALAEMRRLLGVLRTDPEGLMLAPQPGLSHIDDLIAQVRGAGLAVHLERDGDVRSLPVGVDLVAYRVVQESLTNVLKHAGTATATVTIGYRPNHIEVDVSDDGRGAASAGDSAGHGLFGMRERVSLYGGSFEASTADAGGFRVHASIPTVEAR